jgi:hypothetical protein
MRKYADFHEVRFKIPDYHFQMLEDMATYLYEAKAINKPNLQSFGRFCIIQVTNAHLGLMCQWKSARDRHLQQQTLQQQRQQWPYSNSSVYPYSFHQPQQSDYNQKRD